MNQTLKAVLLLLLSVVAVSVGNVFLSLGNKPPTPETDVSPWIRNLAKLGTWPLIILGGSCHAVFFLLYNWALRLVGVSFAQPLTSASIALTALAGYWLLREQVNGLRWLGVALVLVGAILIGLSEKGTPAAPPPEPANRAHP